MTAAELDTLFANGSHREQMQVLHHPNCPQTLLETVIMGTDHWMAQMAAEHPSWSKDDLRDLALRALEQKKTAAAQKLLRNNLDDTALVAEVLRASAAVAPGVHADCCSVVLGGGGRRDFNWPIEIWEAVFSGKMSATTQEQAAMNRMLPPDFAVRLCTQRNKDGTLRPRKNAPLRTMETLISATSDPDVARWAMRSFAERTSEQQAIAHFISRRRWSFNPDLDAQDDERRMAMQMMAVEYAVQDPTLTWALTLVRDLPPELVVTMMGQITFPAASNDPADPMRRRLLSIASSIVERSDLEGTALPAQVVAWGLPEVCAEVLARPNCPSEIRQLASQFTDPTVTIELSLHELNTLVQMTARTMRRDQLTTKLQNALDRRCADRTIDTPPPAVVSTGGGDLADLIGF